MINKLNLKDDDLLYAVRMPKQDCDLCGGKGVSLWDDDGCSVLCDCLDREEGQFMPFKLFRKLCTITKKEVENYVEKTDKK